MEKRKGILSLNYYKETQHIFSYTHTHTHKHTDTHTSITCYQVPSISIYRMENV